MLPALLPQSCTQLVPEFKDDEFDHLVIVQNKAVGEKVSRLDLCTEYPFLTGTSKVVKDTMIFEWGLIKSTKWSLIKRSSAPYVPSSSVTTQNFWMYTNFTLLSTSVEEHI
eukprot:8712334-Ditylum_brightwellii.AAC.1